MGVTRIIRIIGGFLGIHGWNINPKPFDLQCNGFWEIAQLVSIFCRTGNLQNSTKTTVDFLFLAQMSWNLDRRSKCLLSSPIAKFAKIGKNLLFWRIINFSGPRPKNPWWAQDQKFWKKKFSIGIVSKWLFHLYGHIFWQFTWFLINWAYFQPFLRLRPETGIHLFMCFGGENRFFNW